MEIARAIRSPDHTKYVCHFPVHQVIIKNKELKFDFDISFT